MSMEAIEAELDARVALDFLARVGEAIAQLNNGDDKTSILIHALATRNIKLVDMKNTTAIRLKSERSQSE